MTGDLLSPQINEEPVSSGQITGQNLEERLTDFAVLVVEISESLHNTTAGNQLSVEIARSGIWSALYYHAAPDAEAAPDMLDRLKLVLKALRETSVCLKIIRKARLCESGAIVETALVECEELVSTLVASVNAATQEFAGEEKSCA